MEIQLAENSPGFVLPSDLCDIITPPIIPERGPAYLYDDEHTIGASGGGGRMTPTSPQMSRTMSSPQKTHQNQLQTTRGGGTLPPGFPYRTKSRNSKGRYSYVEHEQEEEGKTSHSGGNRGFDHSSFLQDFEIDSLRQPLLILDLSRSSLIGSLSCDGLSSLTSLTTLILDDNQFTGPLPANHITELKNLEILSVERNRLTGPLPVCNSTLSIIFMNVMFLL